MLQHRFQNFTVWKNSLFDLTQRCILQLGPRYVCNLNSSNILCIYNNLWYLLGHYLCILVKILVGSPVTYFQFNSFFLLTSYGCCFILNVEKFSHSYLCERRLSLSMNAYPGWPVFEEMFCLRCLFGCHLWIFVSCNALRQKYGPKLCRIRKNILWTVVGLKPLHRSIIGYLLLNSVIHPFNIVNSGSTS